MAQWVALLKGVNLGGNRSLPMRNLTALLTDIGMTRPRTLLASGNALFGAEGFDAPQIELLLERELVGRLALRTEVFVRSSSEIAEVILRNPFRDEAGIRPDRVVVAFGREPADPDMPNRLARIYDGPERLVVAGRDIYIDFPEGQGRSKLWRAVGRLDLPHGSATARNWNTVRRIAAALDKVAPSQT